MIYFNTTIKSSQLLFFKSENTTIKIYLKIPCASSHIMFSITQNQHPIYAKKFMSKIIKVDENMIFMKAIINITNRCYLFYQ